MGKRAVSKLVYFITIVITFLIVLITILAAFASHFNPADNYIMGYLSIVLPALLIVNVIVAVYWGLRWRLWAWFAVLALVANWQYITAVFQISTEKTPTGKTFKTATLNAHSFNNEITGFTIKEVAKYMEQEDVDIICFQEFHANNEFTMDSIFNTFYSYTYTAVPYIGGGSNIAILSKHSIIDFSPIIFSGETNNIGMWADIQIDNKIVRVFNLHMQTNNLARVQARAKYKPDTEKISLMSSEVIKNFTMRAGQADIVRNIINKSNNPILVCGDFNDTPSSYTYHRLKGDLKDGFKTSGNGYQYTYRGLYNLLRIDYIFHSDDLKGIKYESPSVDWSDHKPVIFEAQI